MVYRQTENATRRLADKRARILAAARGLVADGGWAVAQVDTVAAKAGVATGTVYRHWSSKAELCAEIVAIVSAREVGIVAAVADADGTPVEKLEAAIRTFASRALRGRRLAYALIAEPVDPEVETVRLDYRAQLARCFERVLREGIMRGAFPPLDPAVAAACIVGAFMEALVGPLAPAKGTGRARRSARWSTRSRTSACAPASALGRARHERHRSVRSPAVAAAGRLCDARGDEPGLAAGRPQRLHRRHACWSRSPAARRWDGRDGLLADAGATVASARVARLAHDANRNLPELQAATTASAIASTRSSSIRPGTS